jgi:hypothetical protein
MNHPHSSAKRILWTAMGLCLAAVVVTLLACRSDLTVTVQLMPNSPQTLEPGKSLPISATLSSDPSRKGVSWTLKGDGALVAETTTSVMYQAPSSISEKVSVTVVATSIADGSKAASVTIILVPPIRAVT